MSPLYYNLCSRQHDNSLHTSGMCSVENATSPIFGPLPLFILLEIRTPFLSGPQTRNAVKEAEAAVEPGLLGYRAIRLTESECNDGALQTGDSIHRGDRKKSGGRRWGCRGGAGRETGWLSLTKLTRLEQHVQKELLASGSTLTTLTVCVHNDESRPQETLKNVSCSFSLIGG